jgi:hypothetical protein
MSGWRRFSYGFALTVLVMKVIGLFAMIFSINIVPWVLSGLLFAVTFPIAYLVAPKLSRRIRKG